MSLFDDELRKAQQFRAQINAREEAERAAREYQNRAIANQAAQQKESQGGLGGILSGIAQSIGNVGKGIGDMFTRGAIGMYAGTGLKSLLEGKDYAEANKEAQRDTEDFIKRYYNTDSTKDAYKKAGGTALDAAATVSDFIPGLGTAARVGLNVGQGAASGLAQEFIDNGENANMDNALARALAGAGAAGVGQAVGGKLAGNIPGNGRISRALNSNLGKSALTGAAAGAVGGGLGTALQGGDLGQALAGALQGAQGGALGGAAMGGTMGLLGAGVDKLRNRGNAATNNVVDQLPETAIAKQATEVQAPVRKGIPVTDYDAGTQRVKVNRPNQPTGEYSLGKNAGSTLDGILGPNNKIQLPNAKRPTDSQLFKKATNYDNAGDYIGSLDDEAVQNGLNGWIKDVISPEDYKALKSGAQDYATLNQLAFDGTNASNKSNLPPLDRQQYYDDTIGRLQAQGGQMRAADVPEYMQNHLRNDEARKYGYVSDNETILRELFNDNSSDLGELYDRYDKLAQADNANLVYTPENVQGALKIDRDLNNRVTSGLVNDYGLRNNLEVGGNPSLRQNIDVAIMDAPSNETVYTKRTIAPKAQADQNLPAVRGQVAPAAQEEVPLIQRGTPEYEAIQRREYLDNRARELRNIVTDGVRSQYGTIRLNDRINGLDDAIMELADYGLTKRSQIDGFASRITGSNGEMSKAIRKAMNNAGKTSGRIDISMDDVYRQAGASGNKAAMDKINTEFNSRGKKYTVDANGEMNRSDMYDFGRELEKEGYRMIERGGRTQNNVTEAYGEAMKILGENYIAKATDGVDMRNYISANKLKNLLPGNEAWAKHVDETIPNIKTVSQARSFMAAPTKLSLLADAAEYNKGTYGSNVGNLANDGTRALRAITSSNPARAGLQYVSAKALDSDAVKQKVINNAVKNYKNIEAGGNGKAGIRGAVGAAAGGIGKKMENISRTLNNDTLQKGALGDLATRQIARQAGLAAANDTQLANEQAAAQNALYEAQNNYNTAINNYQNAARQAQAQTNAGAGQLQTISDAMDRALAAGDITAYGQLADLYKKAYAIYGQDTATQNTQKALTANQSKALTGLQQVEQLSQMKPDMGTALANSPLGFLVNMTGGNEYANQAQSLALTLGYLQSGANITPREAENIGKSYVPTAYDSEEVRQQKLARARQLLQNYLGDASALEQ